MVAHTCSPSFLGDYGGKNQLSSRAWGQAGQEKENLCLQIKEQLKRVKLYKSVEGQLQFVRREKSYSKCPS